MGLSLLGAYGQAEPPASSNVLLRVHNTELGAVEGSTDGGRKWHLLARVVRPATHTAPDAVAAGPALVRISGSGALIGFRAGHALRLLPDSTQNRAHLAALTVSPPTAMQALAQILSGSRASLTKVSHARIQAIPDGYEPADGDVFRLDAPMADQVLARSAQALLTAETAYRDHAIARLRKAGRGPTKGILTVSALLTETEKTSVVTFLLNGAGVALVNRPPFTVRWDTRDWLDGEHMIEVRALDRNGSIITRTKTLVYVRNEPDGK